MFTQNRELLPKYGFKYDVRYLKTYSILGIEYIDFCVVLNDINQEPVLSWRNTLENISPLNNMSNVFVFHHHKYVDQYRIYHKHISIENKNEYHTFFQIPLNYCEKLKFIIDKLKINKTEIYDVYYSNYKTDFGEIFSYDIRLCDITHEKHKDHCMEIDFI